MTNGECAKGASNKARIDGLEDNLAAFRGEFNDFRKTIEAALKRPGWATTVVLGILSSACMGLIVSLAHALKDGGG